MKVAIVHDWFMNLRGADRQLLLIAEIFPSADLFFLLANNDLVKEHFYYHLTKIKTSFLDKLPFKQNLYPYFFPLLPLATESLDLREYDLVISSSSHGAKGIITRAGALHVCYMYSSTRHLWDLTHEYFGDKSLLRFIAGPFLYYLRAWDYQAGQRPDKIIAISDFVAKRIAKNYRRDSEVIYPGVKFPVSSIAVKKENYFVHITSFEPNKNTELVVETFKKNKEKLYLVGPSSRKTKAIIKNLPANIEYLGWLTEDAKHKLIAKAQAVIVPGVEDFGIVAVEAQYLGTPVIAYGEGGSLETVERGFIFDQKTVESLQEKITEIKRKKIDFSALRKRAEKFNEARFKSEFKKTVLDAYANWN
jgi:glycosyltransferase involved in cell wall biosynthesis